MMQNRGEALPMMAPLTERYLSLRVSMYVDGREFRLTPDRKCTPLDDTAISSW